MPDAKSDSYWDSFYDDRQGLSGLAAPSQFAAFAIQEFPEACLTVDVGCGTGRDSLFFAAHGRKVIGIDRSARAIAVCEQARKAAAIENARFLHRSIDDEELARELAGLRAEIRLPAAFYARFFLHAIDEREEDAFLDFLAAQATADDLAALEFRTVRDSALHKVTPDHYRRFVEPAQLLAKLHARGFAVRYYVEGFGFAKHRSDDAYVARVLAART